MAQYTPQKLPGKFAPQSCIGPAYWAERATVAHGQSLQPGQVVGKLAAGGKFSALNPLSDTGAGMAAGIAFLGADASEGDTEARVITRGPMLVEDRELTWPAGITPQQKANAVAQLLTLRIKVA